MALIVPPACFLRPDSVTFELVSLSQYTSSPFSPVGRVQGPASAYWRVSYSLAVITGDEGAEARAFLHRLRGQANMTVLYDYYRQQPRGANWGTLPDGWSTPANWADAGAWGAFPGTFSLAENAARGATEIVAQTHVVSGEAFKPGDRFSIGFNLHEIVHRSNTDADGECLIEIVPPLRKGVAAGDVAITYRPRGRFRLAGADAVDASESGRRRTSISFTAVEVPDVGVDL